MFPEETWNLTVSKPMIPLYWGIIDIAQETNVPIIPLVMEFRKNDCYVQFGLPIYVRENDDKKNKINELTDCMETFGRIFMSQLWV